MVQRLRLHALIAQGLNSDHGQGTKIPWTVWCGQNQQQQQQKAKTCGHFEI